MTRPRAGVRPRTRWTQCAARLAEALPRGRLHPAVLAWAGTSPRRATWSVAFSGGADSLCLLLLLWAHWPERRRGLRALHFNHRLRGAASRRDAEFCRRVCRALGVKITVGAWAEARPGASEAAARQARHAFFERHAPALWCGHQQDDIAETFLMRLARGSGTAGLAAPRPVHRLARGRVHLRPLLTVTKAEIVAALRHAGGVWREDASNGSGYFFRNRVRHDVMPAWQRAAERNALAGAAHARELLEEDDVALEAWLEEVAPWGRKGALNLRRLAGKPRGLVRRALHRWLLALPHSSHLSRQAFEILLDNVVAGRVTRQSLGVDCFAVTTKRELRFVTSKNSR